MEHPVIILSGCGEGESAWEINGRGRFTVALLTLLKREGCDQLTYRNLLCALDPLPS